LNLYSDKIYSKLSKKEERYNGQLHFQVTTSEQVIRRVSLEERLAKFVEGSADWKEMQSVANTLYPMLL